MRFLLFIFLLSAAPAYGQQKQICFTYDDLPFVGYRLTDSTTQKALTKKLLQAVHAHRIPAMGFVNEQKIFSGQRRIHYQVEMLRAWPAHGIALGNHTFSHPDYNKVSFSRFSEEILQGEVVTREILQPYHQSPTYFRHPYLHVGSTKAKADSLEDFLTSRNYTIAPVTIDNDDYLFAYAYARAYSKADSSLMKRIGGDYVEYMEQKLHYYEQMSNNLFGKNIRHILLLHASHLNADYTDSLASMFEKNGYSFISLDHALQDPLYKTEITAFGEWGISWLDRWALSAGKKGDFFKDFPNVPGYINDLNK